MQALKTSTNLLCFEPILFKNLNPVSVSVSAQELPEEADGSISEPM